MLCSTSSCRHNQTSLNTNTIRLTHIELMKTFTEPTPPPTLNFNEIDRRYICNFIDIYFELEHFQLAFQFNMRGPGNLRINDKWSFSQPNSFINGRDSVEKISIYQGKKILYNMAIFQIFSLPWTFRHCFSRLGLAPSLEKQALRSTGGKKTWIYSHDINSYCV